MKSSYLHDAYRRVWDAFVGASQTSDGRHDTDEWRSHPGPFVTCVVRVQEADLLPGLPLLDEALASLPGTRVHPAHFLHITLQELGFVADQPRRQDEISTTRLEEFITSAVDPISAAAPFSITLGGANAFNDAVFLEIANGVALAHLHERLFELAALPVLPTYPYLPHCTLAHFDGTCPPRAAANAIAPWRQEQFGSMQVSEIEIVSLDPRQTYPQLESLAVIPLGS